MVKTDLVELVADKMNLTKKDSVALVDQVFNTLKATLEDGESIKISGFGNFVIREKQPRKGRNPQTGDEITISGRRVLTFKPSTILRTRINGDR